MIAEVKGFEHRDAPTHALLIAPLNILEDFDLNLGSLPVLWDALDDFDGHILFLCPIPALRHLAERALSNHLQNLVARQQRLP